MVETSKKYQPSNKFSLWLDSRLPIARFIYDHVVNYPVPRNLNFLYCFGAVLLFMLMVQFFSGIIIAMHFVPHVDFAFASKQNTQHLVNYGWMFNSLHANGASFFFLAAYIHIGRAIYYSSYKAPRELVWWLGIVLYFLMMFVAFSGYVISWGAMSTTALTVISTLLSKIPLIGSFISHLLLGGFQVGQNGLNRLFTLHIIVAFILLFFIGLHIWAVHVVGQSNPLKLPVLSEKDVENFVPYALVKDLLAICCFALIFAFISFYLPDLLQTSDNFIAGDPDIVTGHIEPEWYFLPFYTILRSITFNFLGIPSNMLGFLLLLMAFLILPLLPFIDKSYDNLATRYRTFYKLFFWLFVMDVILLGYLGHLEPNDYVNKLALVGIIYYFSFFLLVLPLLPRLEKKLLANKQKGRSYKSIHEYMEQKNIKKGSSLW